MPNTKQQNNKSVKTIETKNPSTGEVLHKYDLQSKDDAIEVVNNAHKAFKDWKKIDLSKRAEIISNIGKELEKNKDKLAKMMSEQMGKTVKSSKQEVDVCIAICEYTANECPKLLKDEKREANNGHAIITYQPLGVILAMQPWNFPLYQIVRYSVVNFLAGNSTVLKHAEICWDTAIYLKELYIKAGIPDDVFGLVFIDDETVDELISHNKVRGVTLTGSAKAGRIVAAKAGEHLKKTVLELGGSDPYIILKDADIDKAVKVCVKARVGNTGQICIAAKRFIIVSDIYEEFKQKFVEAMDQVKFGDPADSDIDMGPMAREDLRDNLQKQVQESIDKGAKSLLGCKIPEGRGFFYPASVLENVKPGMPAYDDELFGPVASLIKVKDQKEAIEVANDHVYGLGGGIFSKDIEKATEIARSDIDTGMVNINGFELSQPNLPFGGVKDSGYGRENGGYGVREFVNIKTLMICD